ncbi:MAG: type II toxin-antitoxin system VapC family toxin [Aestuariivirga sp.]
MSIVLDASALLAMLWDEPGGDQVEKASQGAAISAVNLAEVVGKLADRGIDEDSAKTYLSRFALNVAEFSEKQAYATGSLRGVTREAGLSLGDRACLSLARTLGLPVLTADRAWKNLQHGVEIKLIR